MTWSDIPRNPSKRTLRQFAAAWLLFFLALGIHQYLARGHREWGVILGTVAIAIGTAGLFRPALVRWLFVGWMVAAFPIGWLVSQLMLCLMFYGVLTPIALGLRLRQRDPLNRKAEPNRSSFWVPKETPQDVRSYFRQY